MIYKKLLEFQKQEISLFRDWTNPHFKSKYVTLNEVLNKVKKPLNELWVVIIQEPQEQGLKTRLIDTEDDTEISSFMPYVECTTAQKLGSNNTYNRRYSLITILWLEDDDDDGNKASERQTTPTEKPEITMEQLEKQFAKVQTKVDAKEDYPNKPAFTAKLSDYYKLNEKAFEAIDTFYSKILF